MTKALIAMSGGVDSSLAAKLMIDKGYECIGCMMKLYESDDDNVSSRSCCSMDDADDARSVATKLGMPFYVFNFVDDFRALVIDRFVDAYRAGMTPNPCIDCNRLMKFDKLMKRAEVLGCDYLVTGHYARIEEKNGRYILKKALDETKDQSYVLYNLTQHQLAHLKLPLGELKKREVRSTAGKAGFINADKPDSQDICFVPDGDYAAVIEKACGMKSRCGEFVDISGNILGQHQGIIHYTVGQRKGLRIAFGKPMYVCSIDADKNRVVLGDENELMSQGAHVTRFNWISGEMPAYSIKCKVKVRYSQKEHWGLVTPSGTDSVSIQFDEPVRAVTPGQAAVLYDGDIVLGGGVIAEGIR
ncbi:MAG: tRNA 2-thiouridine(34) synthase MnmA [Bacillota bacterium]|nr:tRNA 2-thiouridine(34) synthase MnmA [Bacillota bacterium]